MSYKIKIEQTDHGITMFIRGGTVSTIERGFPLMRPIRDPSEVTCIVIRHGVTGLGPRAFADFPNLKRFICNSRLKEIGPQIFADEARGKLEMVMITDLPLVESVAVNPFFNLSNRVSTGDYEKNGHFHPDLPTIYFNQKPEDSKLLCEFRPYPWTWKDTISYPEIKYQVKTHHVPKVTPIYRDVERHPVSRPVPVAYQFDYTDVHWLPRDTQVVPLDFDPKHPRARELCISTKCGSHRPHNLTPGYYWWLPTTTIQDILEDDENHTRKYYGELCDEKKPKKFQYESRVICIGRFGESIDLKLTAASKDPGGLFHAFVFHEIGSNLTKIMAELKPVHPIDCYWGYSLTDWFGSNLPAWRERDERYAGCLCPKQYEQISWDLKIGRYANLTRREYSTAWHRRYWQGLCR